MLKPLMQGAIRRRLVALSTLTLLATALVTAGIARADEQGDQANRPCTALLACGDDVTAVDYLEQRVTSSHFFYGQVIDSYFATSQRLPGNVQSVGSWGDSGLWTGVYLGGESFRYSVAKLHVAHPQLGGGSHDYWEAELADARYKVDTMVAKMHLLVNIAKNWHTTFSPNPTGHPPSFGGGIIQGQEGMLMRACTPWPVDPTLSNIVIQPHGNARIFGPFAWDDGKQYYCETAPSRDTYAGVTFGLLTAFDLVSPDDPAMRAMIHDDCIKLASFLVEHGWLYFRPHGNIVLPPANDFDNFFSYNYMLHVPSARLNIANMARHVADFAGSTSEQLQWDAVWNEEFATQAASLGPEMAIDSSSSRGNGGYYPFNLNHLTLFNLLRTVSEPVEHNVIAAGMGVMDRTTAGDMNAHFEAITYGETGEPNRLTDAVTNLRQWRGYYANVLAGSGVTNSTQCGKTIQCEPQDAMGVALNPGDPPLVNYYPGMSTKLRAAMPLPIPDRPATDFLWQRDPGELDGPAQPTYEPAGVDYLTPYWMIRYFDEVSRPSLAPYPAYVAPSFR
jgi:hypothetical protein